MQNGSRARTEGGRRRFDRAGLGQWQGDRVTLRARAAQVFCVDRNGAAAEETAQIIAGRSGKAIAFTADAANAGEVEAMVAACLRPKGRVETCRQQCRTPRLGNVVDVSEASWDTSSTSISKGFCIAMRRHPVMARQGGGAIINISYDRPPMGHLGISYDTYATTKAAMNLESARGALNTRRKTIQGQAVLQGMMKTALVEHRRIGASYAAATSRRLWRARDAQVPMGHMGDAWDVANRPPHVALFPGFRRVEIRNGSS